MPATFSYRARDPLGNLLQGTLEALTGDDARQQLRRDGFQVFNLEEESGEGLFPRRISRKEIIYATSQLAVMVDTGISLSTALAGIAQEEQNPTWKRVLTDLKNSVESGEDFSTALARYPKYFDKTYIALVRASEATGSLGSMLDRIALYQRKEVDTRSKVRGAMAYPTVMLVIAIAVTIFLLTFILPKFAPLFVSRGVKLPAPTVFMMKLSDSLLGYWPFWVAGLIGLIGGFLYGRRTPQGRFVIDWLKINAPIIGPMNRKVAISRSVRTLGTMVSSGVSVLDALQLSSEVAGNVYYEQLWKKVLNDVTSGEQICGSLRGNPLFPPTVVQMISSGEETGKLDMVLERVSSYFDQEVENSLKTTTSLIEPIMISVMGVVVGGIGLSLLLPIFSLSRHAG
ncbi:MAG TPA: type II secretion system F family protein [Pirellulales bacterium]|jgi:type IV pilus assembly protein PilC|nr:type II secretion system F family protein [Pirellulales bacterium]